MFAQSKGGNYSLTNGASGVADAIDFDGVTDYLSRSSDLAGNADGKTFTFSAWVYIGTMTEGNHYIYRNGSNKVIIQFVTGGISVSCQRSTDTTSILSASYLNSGFDKTWNHVLISIDLSNSANRYIYINDTQITPTWNTYTNDTIGFSDSSHFVGAASGPTVTKSERLSNVYLDYTYRDLSIESNRRLFITADRKPAANQSALNPILYLPLSDPTQPGKNLGTGGDFALNGVVARSGRGPSQFNAPYSDLDGAADYLSRTSVTGIANSKQITVAFEFNRDAFSLDGTVIGTISASNTAIFYVQVDVNGTMFIVGRDSTPTIILNATVTGVNFKIGRNYVVVISLDLTNSANRAVYVNGLQASVTWSNYANININLSAISNFNVGRDAATSNNYFNGRLGNVFFDTRYIDLSNPDNLAKFVTGTGIDAKPADLGANGEKPFGTPPLIYLPMYGNNAGKNYGTGGDFTVVSGPFAGSRGPNEFWGNWASSFVKTGYFGRSNLNGTPDSKTFSFSAWVQCNNYLEDYDVVSLYNGSSQILEAYVAASTGYFVIQGGSGQTITLVTSNGVIGTNLVHICVCVDLSNVSKRFVAINGNLINASFSNYQNVSLPLSNANSVAIGAMKNTGPSRFNGKYSELYFTTDYIDFSQEANRLKFRDAFGNPVDLAPQIAAGTLPNPAIYMRFDPANFGKNSGTGGDFVVNGTITDGGQL